MKQKIDTIEIDRIVEKLTLKVLNACTKPQNYKILMALPTDVNSIMKIINVNRINANKHVNELENVGLIKRERGTGKVYHTELSKNTILLIESIKIKVLDNLKNLLET